MDLSASVVVSRSKRPEGFTKAAAPGAAAAVAAEDGNAAAPGT